MKKTTDVSRIGGGRGEHLLLIGGTILLPLGTYSRTIDCEVWYTAGDPCFIHAKLPVALTSPRNPLTHHIPRSDTGGICAWNPG